MLLEASRELGLCFGEDVSLVTFDDSEFMQAYHPPITVISQRTREIGRVAVEQIERRVQEGPSSEPRHTSVELDLIKRKSVARLGA